MKRWLAVAGIIVVLLTPAGRSVAKGEVGPIHGTATITGPGLATQIVVHWKGRCIFVGFCGGNPLRTPSSFVEIVSAVGLGGYRGAGPFAEPDRLRLGPRYKLAFVLRSRSLGTVRSTVDLYPYGPSDLPQYIKTMPWIHVGPGQKGLDEIGLDAAAWPSGWWPAAPSLQTTLRKLGLPGPGGVSEQSSVPIAGIAGGLVGFVLLLVAGAALGRPRRRTT